MAALRRFVLRAYRLIRRGDAERDLTREIASHLALHEEELRRRGMTAEEAMLAARRAFGGVEQTKELQRAARSFLWLEDLRRDLVYGVRTLARTPGFTAVAVVALALGIGAVTIIYSVLRYVVLDPFPYSRSERLVNVLLKDASGRIVRGPYFPAAEFLDYQEQTPAFEDVVGTSRQPVHWVSAAGAERLTIAWMTPNGFTFLGVAPLLGRVFGAADAMPGAPPVAVMNYRTWVRLFGADPGVVGRTLVLDREPWTVIGVMPPRFEWNIGDLWLPSALSRTDDPQSARGTRAFQAHLRPGVTTSEAAAQLAVVAARRAAEHPGDYPPHSRFEIIKVVDWVVREFRGVLYTLFGAVGLLLVIACCNVANMLLARATTREREIAVRVAIGASRGRIIRQMLVESALLAIGGLLTGCVLAYAGIGALARFMPRQGVPWETELRVDEPVLVFALAVAGLATLGFGLFPAWQSVRRDVVGGASPGGRSSTAGRGHTRMRNSLVVTQVALSIVLLLGAGLLMRTFVNLVGVDLGFDTRNLFVAGVAFPPDRTAPIPDRRNFYRQMIDRVQTLPGVLSVATSSGAATFTGMDSPLEIAGASAQDAQTLVQFCSERFFDTLGLRLLAGRQMSTSEVQTGQKVAIVNETLAVRYFGRADSVGRAIRLPRLATLPAPIPDPTFIVIGVVSDARNDGIRELPAPHVFLPYTLRPSAALGLVVRTAGDPASAITLLRREIQAVSPEAAIVEPETLDALLARVFYARPRFSLLVLGIFACTGIVLVAVGVYGVLAYTVSQRTREIAIRMALGGSHRDVVRMVVRLGMRLVGAGLVIGVAVSLVTNRLLVNQLWNASPHDPVTFSAALSVILVIGAFACWVPARRAVRVEPMVALRHE
jgi:putative ABC transport system permease protein